jgi:hypothetical protein
MQVSSVFRSDSSKARQTLASASGIHDSSMGQTLRILAFAYVYPPDAGSGTFRTLYFTNAWAKGSDDITVVTAKVEHFSADAVVDPNLCATIHPSVRIARASVARPHERLIAWRNKARRGTTDEPARASLVPPHRPNARSSLQWLKDSLSLALSFPDVHSGWIFDAVRQARRVARRDNIDCIYATGGPWSGILAATILHKLTKLPLILDFRDPWASNPNFQRADDMTRRAHAWCERFCVRSASRVIANTEELRNDFVARYPAIPANRFVCVTNGFEDLPPFNAPAAERFTLTHAGELYLTRNPGHFLQAVANLIERGAMSAEKVLIRFVGGVPHEDPHIAELLNELGTAVEVQPRLPHSAALDLQRRSSALLLFQAGLPLQVPRKLYEYLSMRLPILAITEPASATARILDDVGMKYTTPDSVAMIEDALLRLYRDWESGTVRNASEERLARYSNRSLAARLREHMLSVVRGKS